MQHDTDSRPVLFIARSWLGHGGMQRLNHDVAQHVGGRRGGFVCIHPSSRSVWGWTSFCVRSVLAATHLRGRGARVHVADFAALPLGVACAFIAGAKLSATACGLDVIHRRAWYQWMVRRCLRRVDRVIAISHATKQELIARGVPSDRITVIPCGIDETPTLSAERVPHLIVTVGRLVRRKGVAWFVEHVCPLLRQQYPDLRYVIVGHGPEYERIATAIHRAGLHHTVTVMSGLSDAQRAEVLATASVFVAPNIPVAGDMEGFGIVCLEAAAAGLPVAASRLEGLQDALIDGQTGLFFTPNDPQDCVRAISQLFEKPLSSTAVQSTVIDRFHWDQLVPLYNDVFDA